MFAEVSLLWILLWAGALVVSPAPARIFRPSVWGMLGILEPTILRSLFIWMLCCVCTVSPSIAMCVLGVCPCWQ